MLYGIWANGAEKKGNEVQHGVVRWSWASVGFKSVGQKRRHVNVKRNAKTRKRGIFLGGVRGRLIEERERKAWRLVSGQVFCIFAGTEWNRFDAFGLPGQRRLYKGGT